jgi:hypothetical protein
MACGPGKSHESVNKESVFMWKAKRIEEGEFVILLLSGRIDGEHLPELQKIFVSETGNLNLILDMKEVRLVDQDAVRFLSSCETGGTRLRNCPAYIREWIRRGATRNGIRNRRGDKQDDHL